MPETPKRSLRTLWPTVWPLLALLATGFLLFWRTLSSFLVSDDFGQLAAVIDHGPFGLWSAPGGFFRPLSSVSLWLDYRLFGMGSAGYHVTNVLIHCLCAFALFLVVRRLLSESGLLDRVPFAPHAAGLVFLTLSTHSEAVAWVSDRIDLLACLFALLSFYVYLRYSSRHSLPWLLLSGGLYLAGALSKESVTAFPLVIVAYEGVRLAAAPKGRRRLRSSLLAILCFAAMAGVYLGARLAVTHGLNGGWTRSVYADIHLRSVATNLLRLPFRSLLLIPDVPRRVFDALALAGYGLSGVALLALIVRVRRGKTDGSAAASVIVLGVAAVSQLLPVLPLSISLSGSGGERFLYWPSALFCALAVLLVSLTLRRRGWARALCAVFVLGSAATVWRLDENWRTAGALCRSIIASGAEQCPARSIVVVNLPDNYRGAYVFRTSFQAALRVWGRADVQGVWLLSGNTLVQPSDRVDITKLDGSFRISLPTPGTQFVWYSGAPPTSGSVVVSEVEDRSFVLKVAALGADDRVLSYSEGALHRLLP